MQLRFIANYENNQSALRMHYRVFVHVLVGAATGNVSMQLQLLLKMHVIFIGSDQFTRHARASDNSKEN